MASVKRSQSTQAPRASADDLDTAVAAAQRACRGRADAHVLAGVNLPVLLDFLQKRGRLSAAERGGPDRELV